MSSYRIKPRTPTIPMPKEYKDTINSKTEHVTVSTSSQTMNRQSFLEPIYVPRETKSLVTHIVVQNPIITSNVVAVPVTLPSKEIGFIPIIQKTNVSVQAVNVIQVNNPVFSIVSQNPSVTPLPRMVPNLVRF
jgi:hypothetical protein